MEQVQQLLLYLFKQGVQTCVFDPFFDPKHVIIPSNKTKPGYLVQFDMNFIILDL